MSFKGLPWDFANKYPSVLDESHKGLVALNFFNAYIERVFVKKIPPSFFNDGKKVILAEDVSVDWIRENIETQDFFASNTSYFVLQAEQLSKAVKDYILSGEVDWGDRYFVLLYGKDDKSFTSLVKMKSCYSVKVEAPRFWEGQKLIQFLCDQMGIKLPYQMQSLIVDLVPFNVVDYIQTLKKVMIKVQEGESLNPHLLRELVSEHKVDQFELAKLYGEKKFEAFFRKLLSLEMDYSSLMSLFIFLQGHFLKVADPSYIGEKAKPSKYDNNIMVQSRLWSSEDIRVELDFLAECEILSKSKSESLTNKLRLRLIQSY